MVADANTQCTARATLTNYSTDNRYAQPKHLSQVSRDRLSLPLLLGGHPRICSRRIDEGNDRQIKAIGMIHQSRCFAIAPGRCHAEVTRHVVFSIASFLMSQNHDRAISNACQSTYQRRIVITSAIAMQF